MQWVLVDAKSEIFTYRPFMAKKDKNNQNSVIYCNTALIDQVHFDKWTFIEISIF